MNDTTIYRCSFTWAFYTKMQYHFGIYDCSMGKDRCCIYNAKSRPLMGKDRCSMGSNRWITLASTFAV